VTGGGGKPDSECRIPKEIRSPKAGVGQHRRVTDAIDRIEAVAHPDGVQTPPRALSKDPGVDLQVQVPVWVTSTGGVMPHHRRLSLALVLGVVLGLCYPKCGWFWLAWLMPGCFLMLGAGQPGRITFRVGFYAGLGNFLCSLYWLLLIPMKLQAVTAWLTNAKAAVLANPHINDDEVNSVNHKAS